MTKRKRKNKVELEKRKLLLSTILDKWVCFKHIVDNEERYVYMKHRLRDGSSHSKIEQIILCDDPAASGVYYITDYEIDRVLDYARNVEMIEIRPVRFDQIIGIFSEKKRVNDLDELMNYLVNQEYVTDEDIKKYSNYGKKPEGVEEISLGYD